MGAPPRSNRAAIATSLACSIGFLLLALTRSGLAWMDVGVSAWVVTIHDEPFTSVAKLIAVLFDTTSMAVLSLAIGTTLFLLKMKERALLLLGAMAGCAAILRALKTLIYSPRPPNGLMPEAGNSFPSGHVTSSVVLFGLLAFFAWQTWKSARIKVVSGSLVAVLVSFVGFTRVYLNVHWLTDVLAGYLLGMAWLTLCIVVTPYLVNMYKKRRGTSARH